MFALSVVAVLFWVIGFGMARIAANRSRDEGLHRVDFLPVILSPLAGVWGWMVRGPYPELTSGAIECRPFGTEETGSYRD